MRKTTSKKLLDIILLCLFFAELGGMFLPHPVHEVLGCLFIALVVLHNIKNRYFYEHFLSGTYPPLRLANNISIILFAVSLVLLAQWRLVNGIYIGFKKFYQEKCLSFGDKSSYCRFFCMTNRR